MKIGIIGVGAVGLSWAKAISDQAVGTLVLADPQPGQAGRAWAAGRGIAILAGVRELGSVDLVLICTPGFAQPQVVDELLGVARADLAVVDFSTATSDDKRRAGQAGRVAGVTYLDAAITGAVALSGVQTPVLIAGDDCPLAMELFEQFGTPVRVLPGSAPGDAVRVKLLRSVIMKGIEALALDALPAARHYGVLDQLFDTLGDVDRRPFVDLLRSMVQTHPQQAERRRIEVTEASAQLERIGYSTTLTNAVDQAYLRSVQQIHDDGLPTDSSFDAALDWLDCRRDPDQPAAGVPA